jgi:hypothetical protein
MSINRKPPTERDVIERLKRGQLDLPPLRFDVVEVERKSANGAQCDLLVEASWQGQKAKFAAECRAQSTPKAFQDVIRRIQDVKLPRGRLPLVVMPYLSDWQLQELERRGISGVDLCGNGVVVVRERFSVFRTGSKNKFPTYAPIKNIYRRNTSMVARAFLANPFFESALELRDAVNALNLLVTGWNRTPMALSTVSKALKGLEEDLIVDRKQGVRLAQAEKLLGKLQESYEPPRFASRVRLKVESGTNDLARLVRAQAAAAGLPVMASGLSSVARYAVMQREDVLAVYCPRSALLQERLPGKVTDRFPNVELIDTEEEPLYFDAQEEKGFLWASPVQTYLELMAGDKRDRETADQVKAYLASRWGGTDL